MTEHQPEAPAVPGSCGWCRDPGCTGDHPGGAPDLALPAATSCWCGRDEDVCWENGGCRWSAAMSAAQARTAAAELKVTLLRSVLLEGGQDDATARRRALAITGTGEGDDRG